MNTATHAGFRLLVVIFLCVAPLLVPAALQGQTPDETAPVFTPGPTSTGAIIGSGALAAGGKPVAGGRAGAATLARRFLGSFLGAFFGSGFEGFVNAVCDAITKLIRDLLTPPATIPGTGSGVGTNTGSVIPPQTGISTSSGVSTETGLPVATGVSTSSGVSTSTGATSGTGTGSKPPVTGTKTIAETATQTGTTVNTGSTTGTDTGAAPDGGEIETRYAGSPIPRGQQQSPIPGFAPARSPSAKVVAKANAILKRKLPIGSTVQFTIDGKTYIGRMEWHKHAATDNVSDALKDWHHGVTIYQQK